MSQGINKCNFIGNLGKDPEVRYTQNGRAVTSFSIACGYSIKEGDAWVDKTEWVPIVVWGKDAEFICKYGSKGKQVYIEGRFQTRKYEDKDGDTRYASEIVAETVRLLGSRGGDGGGSGGERQQSQRGEQRQQSSGGQRNGGGQRSGGQQSRKPEPEPHDNYIPDAPEDDIPF